MKKKPVIDPELLVKRYVFELNNSFFIAPDNMLLLAGIRPVVTVLCLYTEDPITTHKKPTIGDVISDCNGEILKIIKTVNQ